MIEHEYQHHPMIPEGGRRCVVIASESAGIALHCSRLAEEHYEETLAPEDPAEACDRHSCRHPRDTHTFPANPRIERARCTVDGGPDRADGCPCADFILAPAIMVYS